MKKNYLYFQPEYVHEFNCDGSKCNARCCKNWNIEVDKETYRQYSQIKPESDAEKILAKITADENAQHYCITLDEKNFCPFLNENNLCRLQLKYGENYLSLVCKTFPRFTINFGKFFERSLSLACPVAAEIILFRDGALSFEFVEKLEDDTDKVGILPSSVPEKFVAYFSDIQIAMISILQERTLTIDQRLIVLGFFLDKLDEIISDGLEVDDIGKLIAVYESKNFLSEQVPLMLAAVHFDAKNFTRLMLTIFENLYGQSLQINGQKFIDTLTETFEIFPDRSGKVSVTKIAANYERLADERKNFLAHYSTFLENFLVNELFMTCFPWKFKESISINFGVFVAQYKIFELLTFSAEQKNLGSRKELLEIIDWFTSQTDHSLDLNRKIFECLEGKDDIFSSMEIFLEP